MKSKQGGDLKRLWDRAASMAPKISSTSTPTLLSIDVENQVQDQHRYLLHPGSEKPERPVFQPRDRGEVFWNTALLSIEQTSFLLLHEYEYKVSDITMNNIGTATLRHPQLLYASSRTTRSSGITLAAEQRRRW